MIGHSVPHAARHARRSTRHSLMRRWLRNTRGVAAVEAAFILPIFLVSALMITEFSRVLFAKVEFEYAFYDAARFGMLANGADKAAIEEAVAKRFITLDPEKMGDVTVTETVNPDNSRTATLTATYVVNFLVSVAGHDSVTLTHQTSFLRGS